MAERKEISKLEFEQLESVVPQTLHFRAGRPHDYFSL